MQARTAQVTLLVARHDASRRRRPACLDRHTQGGHRHAGADDEAGPGQHIDVAIDDYGGLLVPLALDSRSDRVGRDHLDVVQVAHDGGDQLLAGGQRGIEVCLADDGAVDHELAAVHRSLGSEDEATARLLRPARLHANESLLAQACVSAEDCPGDGDGGLLLVDDLGEDGVLHRLLGQDDLVRGGAEAGSGDTAGVDVLRVLHA